MDSFAINTEERYAESFKIFRQISEEIPQLVNMLNVCLGDILSKLNFSPQDSYQLNVLSVGGGSGEVDIEILKLLNKKMVQESKGCQIKIDNWVVEPNKYFLDIYEAAIEQLPTSWLKEEEGAEPEQRPKNEGSGEVLFKLLNITFDQFMETNVDKKFHIIHFVHSPYYIDMEQALVHCMGKILHQNGCVIYVVEEDGIVETVVNKLNKVGQSDNATKCKEKNIAERIKKIAENHHWKFENHIDKYKFDISDVFDEQSKTGNLLLDFFTHVVDFCLTNDQVTVQETLDHIRSLALVEDGKHFGSAVERIMFIYNHDN